MGWKSLFIFAEPFSWFVVIILIENAFIVKFYLKWRAGNGFSISILKSLGSLGLSVLSLILTMVLFSTFLHFSVRKSKVDVSPLANLSLEQVGNIKNAISKLEAYNHISPFKRV
jgi:hypothetical protein